MKSLAELSRTACSGLIVFASVSSANPRLACHAPDTQFSASASSRPQTFTKILQLLFLRVQLSFLNRRVMSFEVPAKGLV